MGPLFESGELTEPELVEDLSRLLVAKRVVHPALEQRERAQGGGGQLGGEWQSLKARDHTVSSEDRHEPRQPCCRERAGGQQWLEAQRSEVDDAAAVRALERLPGARQLRGLGDPFAEALIERGVGFLCAARVLGSHPTLFALSEDGRDLDHGRPLRVRLDRRAKHQSLVADLHCIGSREPRLAMKRVALVSEHQTVILRP